MEKFLKEFKKKMESYNAEIVEIRKAVQELDVDKFENIEEFDVELNELEQRKESVDKKINALEKSKKLQEDIYDYEQRNKKDEEETDKNDKGSDEFVELDKTDKEGEDVDMLDIEKRSEQAFVQLTDFIEKREEASEGKGGTDNTLVIENVVTDRLVNKPKREKVAPLYLLDNVNLVDYTGSNINSIEQPLIKETTLGGYTDELEKYNEIKNSMYTLTVNSGKITAFNSISEEVRRVSKKEYGQFLLEDIETAIYKVIDKNILLGTGTKSGSTTHKLHGILNTAKTADNKALFTGKSDIEVEGITSTTLDEIELAYSEVVNVDASSNPVLMLSNSTLHKFIVLENSVGGKVYNVDKVAKTINGVPYLISPYFDEDKNFQMAYGDLNDYLLAVFSDIEISSSDEYEFLNGVRYNKGSIFVGGAPKFTDAFVRVKKLTE